jgi:GDP-4-dehydro-6-deoxy-D-mannose reductase
MPQATLVTGAAGFAGSHLVEGLTRDGVDVAAWHRPGHSALPQLGGRWQAVDLLDRAAVRSALAALRPVRVYHCAGAAHVGQSWATTTATLAVNVRATHHLIEGIREERIDTSVLIPSSAMVYAPADRPLREDDRIGPASPYALSKLAQELVGMDNPGGPRVMIARAFNHMGPRQSPEFAASGFARTIAQIELGHRQPEVEVGNLDARRDFTDVRDTVRAYRLIVDHGLPGRAYNVCTGRAVTIRTLLDLLLARARVPIQVTIDRTRLRPNDVPLVVGDPERIQRELGWYPQASLEHTLDDLLQFWRESLSDPVHELPAV